ncbi:secreted protein [Rhodopirellula europaea SH398]|jgi:hypothetical protein|uniref:Secreted protein n=2 Tax=Rhodopirellula TaxID=265488 RepID=M5RX80_9BACT|nr:secreted protein [Rhodopirellula europaea SH398]
MNSIRRTSPFTDSVSHLLKNKEMNLIRFAMLGLVACSLTITGCGSDEPTVVTGHEEMSPEDVAAENSTADPTAEVNGEQY